MNKLPLFLLAAILLLVAGATPVMAWAAPTVTDATDITYSSFQTVMTQYITSPGFCYIKYGLTSGGEDQTDTQLCEVGVPETFLVTVPDDMRGRVIYYYGDDGAEHSAEHVATLSAGSISETGPTGETSNRFNVTAYAINGSEVWFEFGSQPGIRNWKSAIFDVTDIDMVLTLEGSPMYGGETVYYTVCDTNSCTAENHATLLSVTTIPTMPAARQLFTNITRSRFAPTVIGASLLGAYTQVAPVMIVISFAALMLFTGMWMRTKTARLPFVLGVIMAAFISTSSSGLMLGLPAVSSLVGAGLAALVLTGIVWAFIHR